MDPNEGRGRQTYKFAGESDWEAYDRRRRAATPVPIKPEDQEMLKDFDWPGSSVSSPDGSHRAVSQREESANAEAESTTTPDVFGNLRWNEPSVHLPLPGDSGERPVTRRQSTASNPRNRERSVESRHQGTTRIRSPIPNLTPAVRYTSRPARYSLPALQSGTNQSQSIETRRGRSLTPRPLGEETSKPVPAAAPTELQQRSRIGEVEPPKNPSSETNASTDGPAPAVTPRPSDPQVVPHTSGPQSDAASATSSYRPCQGAHSYSSALSIGEVEPPESTVSSPSQYSVTTDGRPRSSDPQVVPYTRGPQSDVASAASSHRAGQGGHSRSPAPHIGEVEPPENTVSSSSQNSAATDDAPPAITPRSSESQVVPHTSELQSDAASVTSSHRAPQEDQSSPALIKTESRVLSILPEQPRPESTQVAQENVKRSKLSRITRILLSKLKHLVKRNHAPAAVQMNDAEQVNLPVVKRGLLTKLKKLVKSRAPTPHDVHQDHQFPPASEEAALFSQLPALDFNRGHKSELARLQYNYGY